MTLQTSLNTMGSLKRVHPADSQGLRRGRGGHCLGPAHLPPRLERGQQPESEAKDSDFRTPSLSSS